MPLAEEGDERQLDDIGLPHDDALDAHSQVSGDTLDGVHVCGRKAGGGGIGHVLPLAGDGRGWTGSARIPWHTGAMSDVRSIALGDNTVHLVWRQGTRLLVDTGPDYAGAWEALREGLAGELPEVVVATHGHHDHAGLGRRWKEAGAPIWVGAADGPLTARPPLQSQAETAAMLAWAEGTGAPPETLAHVRERVESRRAAARRAAAESPDYPEDGLRWPTGLRYPPFEADRLIEGDAEIAGIEIVATPGHTPGNVVLAVREEGWLFSGDQLLPEVDPLPAIQFVAEGEGLRRFPSLPHFAASLQRLAEGGFTRCFPGHGEPFDGATEAIAGALSRIGAALRARAQVTGGLRPGDGA